MTYIQNKVNKGQECSGELSTQLKGLRRIGTKFQIILERSNLGHNRKFQHYTVYAKVGQLKVNNNQVMYHLSMKLSDTFDQNPPCTFDRIRENHSNEKCSHSLNLRVKVKVIAKIKNNAPGSNEHAIHQKKMSRDSPNYWSQTDLSNML